MENFVSGTSGLIHLLASIVALVYGSIVIFTRKGTSKHKRRGYVYVIAMVILNGSAFMLYGLFGKFGIFRSPHHYSNIGELREDGYPYHH